MLARLSRWALALLFATNLTSVFGFAVFSLHPELLARWPWTQDVFQMSYAFFARLQILLAFLTVALVLCDRVRGKWVTSLLAIFAISFVAEFVGTSFGIPFGKYEYTILLGPKIFDHVPFLIPVSWFFMSLASYGIVATILRARRSSAALRVGLSSLLLLSWDLTLDPAMSHLSPFWLWAETGTYYGTPLTNLFGWFFTGVINMAALEILEVRDWLDEVPHKFWVVFYFANLCLPLGIVVAAGMWTPVLLSAGLYLAFYLIWSTRFRPLVPKAL